MPKITDPGRCGSVSETLYNTIHYQEKEILIQADTATRSQLDTGRLRNRFSPSPQSSRVLVAQEEISSAYPRLSADQDSDLEVVGEDKEIRVLREEKNIQVVGEQKNIQVVGEEKNIQVVGEQKNIQVLRQEKEVMGKGSFRQFLHDKG